MDYRTKFYSKTLLTSAIALLLSSCDGSGEGFDALEEASAFLNGETIEINSWYPEDDIVVVPANTTKTFGISVQGSSKPNVVYSFYIEDQLIDTGSEPFYNLSGSQLGELAENFTIKVTDGFVSDEHTFKIVVNTPPQITSSSPLDRSTVVDCSDPLFVFVASAEDPEGNELEFNWTLNDGLLDETIFVETTESQSRAAATIDCDNTINNTLTLQVSDGIDVTEVSWTYMDPVSGAIGEVGNSAIEFDPISHDFGFAKASSDSLSKTFTATNSALTDVYITEFTGENDHFTIAATTCPTAPEKFEAGDDCTITVTFAPTQAGALGVNLEVSYYAEGNSDTSFKSLIGLAGTGVSPLVFDGVQSLSNLRHNKVTLNWNQTASAATFVAFQVSGGLVYHATEINTNGTISSMLIEDLLPSTNYVFRIKATDVFGNLDSNEIDIAVNTLANNSPVPGINSNPSLYSGEYISTVDAYDTNTNSDLDQDGDEITYSCVYERLTTGGFAYATGNCDTLQNEPVASGQSASFNTQAGVFSNWKPLHADIGATYRFTITAADDYGASLTYQFSNTIEQGVPDEPTISSITPNTSVDGPANNNTPTVTGTGTANLEVSLYRGASCDTLVGTGTADGAGNFSIQITVPDDGTYTIKGRTKNAINNYSDCSSTSVTYEEDSTAPTPFNISGTTPDSPADSMTPSIVGTAEANATIRIYDDNGCTNEVANGTAAGDGSYSITVNATADDTTTYYAVAIDDAGNATNCTDNTIDYENYSIAQYVGWFTGTVTASASEPAYQLNPSALTDLDWSSSAYDSTYFRHSRTTDSHEVEVLQAGDYFVSFNLPVDFFGSERPAIRAELYVDGVPVKGAIGESTYIRNASSHTESSANFAILAPNLTANQKLTVKVIRTSGDVTADQEIVILADGAKFNMFVEFVDASRSFFYASFDSNSDLDVNTGFDIEWTTDVEKSADFTHSTGTDPEEITIPNSGQYLVHFSAPVESVNARVSTKMQILRKPSGGAFAAIESAVAMQGYMRAADGHYNSSLHFSGLIELTAGDVIKFQTIQDAASGTVNITDDKDAMVFIEKVDTANNFFYAVDSYTTDNWNTSSATDIDWSAPTIEDATHFGSATSTQVDIDTAGDYLLIYNNSFSSTVQRANVRSTVNLNGVAIADTELKCHYIRAASGHNRASGSIVYMLRDVPANSYVEITHAREAASGNVTKYNDAQIILIRKP